MKLFEGFDYFEKKKNPFFDMVSCGCPSSDKKLIGIWCRRAKTLSVEVIKTHIAFIFY